MSEIDTNLLALTGRDLDRRWNMGSELGTPVTVTYNFPDTRPDYDTETARFDPFPSGAEVYAGQVLDLWAAASGIHFVRIPDDETAEITFSLLDMSGQLNSSGNPRSGYAYYPTRSRFTLSDGTEVEQNVTGTIGGDVFIDSNQFASAGSFAPGQRGFSLLLHEVGHAIGLKHPFSGDPVIDPGFDTGSYTVMSYDRSRSTTTLGSLDDDATRVLYGRDVPVTAYWDAGLAALVQEAPDGGRALFGQTVADVMIGGAGNDMFYRAGAEDTVTGGDGWDIVVIAEFFRTGMVTQGPEGLEIALDDGGVLRVSEVETLRFLNLDTRGEDIFGPGRSVYGNASSETLEGTPGSDVILGRDGDDTITASTGSDSIRAGEGDDSVDAGPGRDTLAGEAGNDTLLGGDGHDLGYGGDGLDLLEGGAGRDSLYGGAGDDTVLGGDGDDLLGGTGGNDLLSGGAGADALWTALGDDTADGGAGNDTLGGALGDDDLSGGDGDDEIWGAAGNDTARGGDGDDTAGGSLGDDSLSGQAGDDELWGAAGQDTLEGGAGADQLGGGPGNDSLTGGSENDSLYGGLGQDTVAGQYGDDLIFGAGGNDLLSGGAGDDTLWGGPGADVILYGAGDGADVIGFFAPVEDRLQLNADLWTGPLTAAEVVAMFGSDVGADYVLDFGNGDTITLAGAAGIAGLEAAIDIV